MDTITCNTDNSHIQKLFLSDVYQNKVILEPSFKVLFNEVASRKKCDWCGGDHCLWICPLHDCDYCGGGHSELVCSSINSDDFFPHYWF